MKDWLNQCHFGDCLEVMRGMPDNCVDSIVTDPPYGLSFMGKKWDYDVPGVDVWTECLRVLKPGGHLLAFAGTRTQHRMAVRIEDAGFEIRDMIAWVYGSGFPKSLDVSKAIDKARDDSAAGLRVGAWLKAQREARGFKQKDVAALWPSSTGGLTGCVANWETLGKVPKWDQWLMLKAFIGLGDDMDSEVWHLNGRKGTPGNEREIISERPASGIGHNGAAYGGHTDGATQKFDAGPATEAAQQWQGWGTALKPALEPITVARKPFSGNVASNVLAHGTGALNIDGCRVAGTDKPVPFGNPTQAEGWRLNKRETDWQPSEIGRWPANLIHDGSDEVVAGFPQSAGQQGDVRGTEPSGVTNGIYGDFTGRVASAARNDTGSAARFFYCAKASKEDRNEGCTGLPEKVGGMVSNTSGQHITRRDGGAPGPRANHHPTVKPTDLMRYLCRLVTPARGIVLDPFMGSGSTGCAAVLEGFKFIGIEREAEYVEIAQARISSAKAQGFQPSLDLEAA